MKAKEYAKKYLDSEGKEFANIAIQFLNEIGELAKLRNVKTDFGLIPICKELNKKWFKFAQIINSKYPVTKPILYNGFQNLVKKSSPDLYKLWYNNK